MEYLICVYIIGVWAFFAVHIGAMLASVATMFSMYLAKRHERAIEDVRIPRAIAVRGARRVQCLRCGHDYDGRMSRCLCTWVR